MILFIRHGETNLNAKKIVAGAKMNVPINKVGKLQAKLTAERLKDTKIDVVFCSPMKRARQTAKIVMKYHKKVPIFYDERLRERDWGVFDGKPEALLPENYWHFGTELPKSVESVDMLYERIKMFYDDVLENYKGKTVLVVAHNGIARVSGLYFKGFPKFKDFNMYQRDNAGVWQLTE